MFQKDFRLVSTTDTGDELDDKRSFSKQYTLSFEYEGLNIEIFIAICIAVFGNTDESDSQESSLILTIVSEHKFLIRGLNKRKGFTKLLIDFPRNFQRFAMLKN